jgi:hypothetical protein
MAMPPLPQGRSSDQPEPDGDYKDQKSHQHEHGGICGEEGGLEDVLKERSPPVNSNMNLAKHGHSFANEGDPALRNYCTAKTE